MIIYRAKNKINCKNYIGQTIYSIDQRKKAHKRLYKNDKGFCFHNAIKKYGWNNFEWFILEKCNSKKELDEMEYHYIKQYNTYYGNNNGYNMTYGGNGGLSSLEKGSQEYNDICEKISKANKGKIAWNKGLTKETDKRILKYAIKRKDQVFDEDTRKKMSMSAKKRCNKGYVEDFIKRMTSNEIISKRKKSIAENKTYSGKNNPRWNKNIDDNKIKNLILKGYNGNKISKILGYPTTTTYRRIKIIKSEQ
jgi:hypothetical protein